MDERGNPIPGSYNFDSRNIPKGLLTDMDGRYTIQVRPTDALRVSFIGYKTDIVAIKGKTKVNITFESHCREY
ncbi:MAG: hypothetical protein V8R91_07515 [Butyricimonas faecihominis]